MSKDTDTNAQLQLVRDCLRMQIDELSMLQSIFCAAAELNVDDASIEADVNAFLDGESTTISSHLQYTIRQQLGNSNDRLDLRIELPHLYPLLELANVSVLSAAIGKVASDTLRQDLNAYMRSLDPSEVYVYQVYQWVQDNATNYINYKTKIDDSQISNALERIEMERLWIYSHHLKSSTKRQEIITLAKALDLSGFSRPGKPGIICVEGRKVDAREFWRTIRQWCWQKIQVRKSEVKAVTGVAGVESFRRFALPLQEKLFLNNDDVNRNKGIAAGDNKTDVSNGEEQQMSMALFIKFLENHRCAYIKKDLFGFE